jgi:hypothetical protein
MRPTSLYGAVVDTRDSVVDVGASVTSLIAPAEVSVEALEDLRGAPLKLGQGDRAESWADVVADQAVICRASADADLVLAEPEVEQVTEAGLGPCRLHRVGLGEEADSRSFGFLQRGACLRQDDPLTRGRVGAGGDTYLVAAAVGADASPLAAVSCGRRGGHKSDRTGLRGPVGGPRSLTVARQQRSKSLSWGDGARSAGLEPATS